MMCLKEPGPILVWQDRFMPPDQRTNYRCDREATGPVNRKHLIEHINKIALETPDKPDAVPYVAGVVRGKKVGHFPINRQSVRPFSFFFFFAPAL